MVFSTKKPTFAWISLTMSKEIHTYSDATAFLFSSLPMYQRVGKIAYKPDLSTAQAFDRYFNKPHAAFKSIHVAGTNGKGSVSHMLASILQSAGYRVGLFTSPHLKDFRERITINGEMIAEQEVLDFVVQHKAKIAELQPSFFEMSTAMAFYYFAQKKVDVAIIETGMGGRLDATNVIKPLLSVITNIGLDHTEHLGDTLPLVAAEKAGIIKKKTPVVVGDWHRETAPVFDRQAAEQESPVYYADNYFRVLSAEVKDKLQHFIIAAADSLFSCQVSLDLLGAYQRANVATVLTVVKVLRDKVLYPHSRRLMISDDAVLRGLSQVVQQTRLRGRWEVIGEQPLMICDTGHNAHGLSESMTQLQAMSYRRLHFIFGVVNDKDLDSILPLLPPEAYYYFTKADLPRAMDEHTLYQRCTDFGLQGQIVQTVANAMKIAKSNAYPNDIIFIGGSTFVVAEALQ